MVFSVSAAPSEVGEEIVVSDPELTGSELGDSSGVSVYSVLDPVSSSNANGFKKIMLELIGDYEGIVTEHAYENYNGSVSYVREITPDYVWLCSCAIFLVMLYCCFRLGAAVLCKK